MNNKNLGNLEEMGKFLLVIYKLPKLNQENLNSLTRSIKINNIEVVNFKNPPMKKSLGLEGSLCNSTEPLKVN